MRISYGYIRVVMVCLLLACGSIAGFAAPGEAAPATNAAPAAKAAPAKQKETVRVWKTVSGNETTAEYVESKYGRVTLRTAEGKLLAIAERSLSAEDRAWIKAYEERQNAPAGIKQPTTPNKLPVFEGGKHPGYYAIYNSPNFDACMNADGLIEVYPKENDKRTDKPIRVSMACYYYDDDKRMRGRGVVSFSAPPPPKLQPETISLNGMLPDGVSFNVSYEFSDKGIKGYGYCNDPKDIEFITRYRIIAWVPPSHSFARELPMDKRKEILKGWQIVIEPITGKNLTYTYWESVRGWSMYAKKLLVDSPAFGKRQISFKPGKPDKGRLIPYIYGGNAVHQGFAAQLIKVDNDSKSKGEYMMLQID